MRADAGPPAPLMHCRRHPLRWAARSRLALLSAPRNASALHKSLARVRQWKMLRWSIWSSTCGWRKVSAAGGGQRQSEHGGQRRGGARRTSALIASVQLGGGGSVQNRARD